MGNLNSLVPLRSADEDKAVPTLLGECLEHAPACVTEFPASCDAPCCPAGVTQAHEPYKNCLNLGFRGIPSEDVRVRVDVLGCTSERPFDPADTGIRLQQIAIVFVTMLPSGRERELYKSQITRALAHIQKYTPRQRLPCAWRHPGQFERLGNNPTQVIVAHALKQITCAAVVKAFIK
jgi:hypothetical protein